MTLTSPLGLPVEQALDTTTQPGRGVPGAYGYVRISRLQRRTSVPIGNGEQHIVYFARSYSPTEQLLNLVVSRRTPLHESSVRPVVPVVRRRLHSQSGIHQADRGIVRGVVHALDG